MTDKKITYRDQIYMVPDWARFIAADEDGSVYVYAEKPDAESACGQWFPPEYFHGGWSRAERVLPQYDAWADSLQEIPEWPLS